MVKEESRDGRVVYVCGCGLGYDDILIAYACEEYNRKYGVNSDEITKRAVYKARIIEHDKLTA